ncbi:small redox-active disulfide protein 2 [Thermosyntropha lipolytica DSM 11003]|uniref:Small redox-active disulfide protein 2 n=1 Tax=Thermosyntropha lipolytica DSM 11003 TaxID=1123382 RepID=A0A1M5RJ24_9FIRM|nr:thioredoxin family protein [Thermosyntropha lipolytica]SHH26098.1 small redox-active disulfide protein 2 [Thermosyntropha lipolytica DSM 11003]
MKIEVLGTGCAKCNKLAEEVRSALAEMDVAAELTKVEDIKKIMSYKVMMTPALVINGKVKAAGKVLKREEIKKFIQEEMQNRNE